MYEIKKLRPYPTKDKIRVAFYSNDPALPVGYSKVIREIGTRLNKDPLYEVCFISEQQRAKTTDFQGMPVFGTDPKQMWQSIERTIREQNIDIFFCIEDAFTLYNQGIHNIDFGRTKFVLYCAEDGMWIPTTSHPVIRKADKLVAFTKFSSSVLTNENFVNDVISHGVDLLDFCPVSNDKKKELRKKYNLPEDNFIMFNYGRNSARKMWQRMLEAVGMFLVNTDKVTFFMHMHNYKDAHGNVQDFIDRHLTKIVGKDLNDKIFINSSEVPDNVIAEFIQLSDIVISGSSGESFGFIMAEAMACGVPLVHHQYSTPVELIEEERNGIGQRGLTVKTALKHISSYNVEHGLVDIEDFVEKINTLYRSETLRRKFGKNGRMFAEKYLNWDLIVEEWKNLFEEIV